MVVNSKSDGPCNKAQLHRVIRARIPIDHSKSYREAAEETYSIAQNSQFSTFTTRNTAILHHRM